MNNTNTITNEVSDADLAKVEYKGVRTTTGGTIMVSVATLNDGRQFSFMERRMSRWALVRSINFAIRREAKYA